MKYQLQYKITGWNTCKDSNYKKMEYDTIGEAEKDLEKKISIYNKAGEHITIRIAEKVSARRFLTIKEVSC